MRNGIRACRSNHRRMRRRPVQAPGEEQGRPVLAGREQRPDRAGLTPLLTYPFASSSRARALFLVRGCGRPRNRQAVDRHHAIATGSGGCARRGRPVNTLEAARETTRCTNVLDQQGDLGSAQPAVTEPESAVHGETPWGRASKPPVVTVKLGVADVWLIGDDVDEVRRTNDDLAHAAAGEGTLHTG
jgi:hypothetical protein